MIILITSLLKAFFIADFLSGLGHWWEDRYATVKMKWIAKSIVLPNLLHHKMPKEFLYKGYWKRNDVMIYVTLLIGIVAYCCNVLTMTFFLTLVILSQINEVHAFAHRSPKDVPKFVRFLQKKGVLQSAKHHNLHHSDQHQYHFCILSNFLNPILDKMQFFRFLERIILFFNIQTNQ